MTIYFHGASASFYDTAHYDKSLIPADVVKITAARYRALEADMCAGFQIIADADGRPVSIDPRSAMTDEQRLSEIRSKRDRLLSACDYIMMPDYPIDADTRVCWASYRQALRDLPSVWASGPANIVGLFRLVDSLLRGQSLRCFVDDLGLENGVFSRHGLPLVFVISPQMIDAKAPCEQKQERGRPPETAN